MVNKLRKIYKINVTVRVVDQGVGLLVTGYWWLVNGY